MNEYDYIPLKIYLPKQVTSHIWYISFPYSGLNPPHILNFTPALTLVLQALTSHPLDQVLSQS